MNRYLGHDVGGVNSRGKNFDENQATTQTEVSSTGIHTL